MRYSIQFITPINTIESGKNDREAAVFLPRPKISAKLDQIKLLYLQKWFLVKFQIGCIS